MTEEYIRDRLFALQDLKYRDFHSKLMPTVDKDLVIGVRTPALRKLAKEISKTEYAEVFLKILPHEYYEENNLHAFLIEEIKDYDACIYEINRFLPFVDNWATCDMMRPKTLFRYPAKLLEEIKKWIKSDDVYAVRFGIEMLMCRFLDGDFKAEYPEWVCEIHSDEYYIKMMQAWYFATALSLRYDEIVSYIENNRLDEDVHNKTIRKAIESYRISEEKKNYLRKLRR